MALSTNSKLVFDYVKAHDGEDFTHKDIAAALGLTDKQVTGCVNAFTNAKKGYMVRVEGLVQDAEGVTSKVKFIKLTDAGREFDPNAEETAE